MHLWYQHAGVNVDTFIQGNMGVPVDTRETENAIHSHNGFNNTI